MGRKSYHHTLSANLSRLCRNIAEKVGMPAMHTIKRADSHNGQVEVWQGVKAIVCANFRHNRCLNIEIFLLLDKVCHLFQKSGNIVVLDHNTEREVQGLGGKVEYAFDTRINEW